MISTVLPARSLPTPVAAVLVPKGEVPVLPVPMPAHRGAALEAAGALTAAPDLGKSVSVDTVRNRANDLWQGFMGNGLVRTILRHGANSWPGQGALRGLQRLMPSSLFPELNGPGGPTRVIINSDPDQRDATNEGHILFSQVFPHGRRTHNASTVAGALRSILEGLPRGQRLQELSFYGHGSAGQMQIGNQYLTLEHIQAALDPRNNSPEAVLLRQLRDRMDPNGHIYLRGCECFQGQDGRAFGQALANFFGCPVTGHTECIGGPYRPGQVSFRPERR